METMIVVVVITALIFDFTNGWNDSANSIATVISTRVLPPWLALLLAALLNFGGAMLGTEVAMTIGKGVVDPSSVTLFTVFAAMLSASIWTAACTMLGLPISCSHALIGGIIGAAVGTAGFGIFKPDGIYKILIALFASPLLGFIMAYILLVIVLWLARGITPRTGRGLFGFLQIVSSSAMSISHGQNDAQKVMGVITMALIAGNFVPKDIHSPPMWVILACGTSMAVGTAIGGAKVIRTLGMKLARITPVEGFAAETAASGVLTLAAMLGVPVSTTHTITGSIMGVGSVLRFKTVQWGLGAKIVYAWILTLPVCFAMGWLIALFGR